MRSYTETRRSLPSLIGVANGFNQELDAYLGFTVFIDPQLICSYMGKIDDCALLAEFSIVDHHNHTFIGVFALHFHLLPKRQLAVGSCQGVPPKDLTTGGFVSVEARPIPSGPTNKRLLRCRLNIVVGLGVLDLVAGSAHSDQQHKPDDR